MSKWVDSMLLGIVLLIIILPTFEESFVRGYIDIDGILAVLAKNVRESVQRTIRDPLPSAPGEVK